MKKSHYKGFIFGSICLLSGLLTFCSKEATVDLNSSSMDTFLYKESQKIDGYYRAYSNKKLNKDTALEKYASGTNSPHGKIYSSKLNSKAYNSMDLDTANGNQNLYRPKTGKNIMDSSIFVLTGFKTLEQSDPDITLVMMKLPKSDLSYGGYIWAGYKKGGVILFKTDSKGSACAGCHVNANFDYLLEFD